MGNPFYSRDRVGSWPHSRPLFPGFQQEEPSGRTAKMETPPRFVELRARACRLARSPRLVHWAVLARWLRVPDLDWPGWHLGDPGVRVLGRGSAMGVEWARSAEDGGEGVRRWEGVCWDGKRRRGCSMKLATERRRLPPGSGRCAGSWGWGQGRQGNNRYEGREERDEGVGEAEGIDRVGGWGEWVGEGGAHTSAGTASSRPWDSCRADLSPQATGHKSDVPLWKRLFSPSSWEYSTLALLLTYLQPRTNP